MTEVQRSNGLFDDGIRMFAVCREQAPRREPGLRWWVECLVVAVLVDGVSSSITSFVAVELCVRMLNRMLSAGRHWAMVTVVRVEVVVYMTVKVMRAVKPWAGSDKDAAGKPFRAVVAVRRAGIGGVVIVSVGAYRRSANSDGDLSMRWGGRKNEKATCCR